ncbi:transposon Tf2-9 polyprotein, partial [Nephila pilipes]
CCIPKYADIIESLIKFLEGHENEKEQPRSNTRNCTKQVEWNDDANLSFKVSKDALVNATLLRYPILGFELGLRVDASNVAVGGSITQLSNSQ